MNDWQEWVSYVLLAALCGAGYALIGYLSRKTYNRVSEGRHR